MASTEFILLRKQTRFWPLRTRFWSAGGELWFSEPCTWGFHSGICHCLNWS